VVFDSVVHTTKPYMRTVSPVSWAWLKEPFERMVHVDMHRLVGPSYARAISTAFQVDPSIGTGEGSKGAATSVSGVAAASATRRNDDAAVSDARQRYLDRKAASK